LWVGAFLDYVTEMYSINLHCKLLLVIIFICFIKINNEQTL